MTTMTMRIHTKLCPHCKTGDIYIEDHVDNTFGRLYEAKCIQCGWSKDITNIVLKWRKNNAPPSRT